MKDFTLSSVSRSVSVEIKDGIICVKGTDTYLLDLSHYDKLASFKTPHVLIAYAMANQFVAPSHQSLPSDDCGATPSLPTLHPSNDAVGNTSPVAGSEPTASDTLLLPLNDTGNSCLTFEIDDDELSVQLICHYRDGVIGISSCNPNFIDNFDDFKRFKLPYTPDLLAMLLTCRNPQRLWAMAQVFRGNDK